MPDESEGRSLGERPGGRELFLRKLGGEIEKFLLYLEDTPNALFAYVKDPFDYLKEFNDPNIPLCNEAKALLLESNYSVIKEVMSKRESTAVRWVCVWVI